MAVGAVVALAACTADPPPGPGRTDGASASASPERLAAQAQAPGGPVTLVPDGTPEAVALATSRALFTTAPAVVLAPADDARAVLLAASGAVGLGAPVLLTGAGVPDADLTAELERLGARAALTLGAASLPAGSDIDAVAPAVAPDEVDALPHALADATAARFGDAQPVPAGQEVAAVVGLAADGTAVLVPDALPAAPATTAAPGDAAGAGATSTGRPGASGSSAPTDRGSADPSASVLPPVERPAAPAGALVLTDGSPAHLAAVATARAAGVPVSVVPGGDPRATAASVEAVAAAAPQAVLALGSSFGTPELLAPRVASAATGVQLPGGGQLVFPALPGQPGKRYVALYGTPGTGALGVLGEQDVPATLARADGHAAPYRTLTSDTVVPTLEIIATIASSGAEADGSYSRRRAVEDLRPLVDAAGAAGMLVILDLQPGRTDFVTQAQAYAELLALPHVGLALDPEWRLGPDQVHLRQIGSVGVDEVNAVIAWLATFTRERALPQKMLVLHQFQPRMVAERERLDLSHDELALLVHVDGQGGQPAKAGTWARLREGAQPQLRWGWKNFYDEDVPMLDPVQTMQVQPVPDLVTYQ
ncbi:hypothetical protein [Cellulomonas cellasea]|uniref:Lipoprotein n=1 Tax=Cellulomonas cellasea TaxID=43670 RepID=A0A7W4UCP6_9CELL|nr:hypothetical protein [Cellulomonas cellasea]MBB2921364.1 hypothetical protein [Cellulomonas cellasea]